MCAGRAGSDGNPFAALQLRGAYSGEGARQAQEHFIDVGVADIQRRGKAQAVGLWGIEQQTFVQRGLDHRVSGVVGKLTTWMTWFAKEGNISWAVESQAFRMKWS